MFGYEDISLLWVAFFVTTVAVIASVCYSRCSSPTLDGCKRTVVVTGAASGLGRATCHKLAATGDFVVAMDMNESLLQTLLKELPENTCMVVPVNVSQADSVAAAIKAVQAKLGVSSIDALVNFAGVMRGGPLVEMDAAQMQLVMDVNVMGTFRMTQALFPLLRREQGKGAGDPSPKIINIASEVSYAHFTACFSAPYCMSKLAVEGLSVALRQELALLEHPVKVAVVNPGAYITPMGVAPSSLLSAAAAKPGTMYADNLAKGIASAQDYQRRNASTDLGEVASVISEIVHDYKPKARYVVGASFEMKWLIPYLPQSVLDTIIDKLNR